MNYQITYSLISDNVSEESDQELLVGSALEAKPIIEKMSSNEDIVYIYNVDSGDQLEVSCCDNEYLVRYLLLNGFYRKTCNMTEVLEILASIDKVGVDPKLLGMESFE